MQTLSLIWGLLSVSGMLVAFVPCLGSLNWLNIPFSGMGFLISIIALVTAKEGNKTGAIAGLICCAMAIFFGLFRLLAGGGIV